MANARKSVEVRGCRPNDIIEEDSPTSSSKMMELTHKLFEAKRLKEVYYEN